MGKPHFRVGHLRLHEHDHQFGHWLKHPQGAGVTWGGQCRQRSDPNRYDLGRQVKTVQEVQEVVARTPGVSSF